MKHPLKLKRGTVLKNIRSGEHVIFLKMVNGAYYVWHRVFKGCHFSAGQIMDKWKVVQ